MSTEEHSDGELQGSKELPEEPQASTSAAARAPSQNQPEEDPFLNGRTSAHIISIFDMVWTGLEVVLVLMCTLPSVRISWETALICLIPNTIQFSAAYLMYKKTEELQDSLILYRSCQLWLFLAFLVVSLQAAFVTWTTVTGIVTKFLIFILVLKFLWRLTAMFFINEFHNELELLCSIHTNYNLLIDVEDSTTVNRLTNSGNFSS